MSLHVSDPTGPDTELAFGIEDLKTLRTLAARAATEAGLKPSRIADFVLAVNEIATNSLRHGGGRGVMQLWCEDTALLCEVTDAGSIDLPLVARNPSIGQEGGFGLWLVHQVCDRVEIRTHEDGSLVRLHMARDA